MKKAWTAICSFPFWRLCPLPAVAAALLPHRAACPELHVTPGYERLALTAPIFFFPWTLRWCFINLGS